MRNRGTALALCVSAATAAIGCTKTLDMDKLKGEVKSGISSQLGVQVKDVTCPENRTIKSGDVFECKATGQVGATFAVKITQTDDRGNVNWELTSNEGLLDLKKLEEQIAASLNEQTGIDGKVDCGGAKFREAEPGKTFDCKASGPGGEEATLTVTMKDKAGNVGWDLKAAPADGE